MDSFFDTTWANLPEEIHEAVVEYCEMIPTSSSYFYNESRANINSSLIKSLSDIIGGSLSKKLRGLPWIQHYGYCDVHNIHTHEHEINNRRSGIIYLDNLGGTVFCNPFVLTNPDKKFSVDQFMKKVESEKNKMVTFPSWMPHHIPPHGEKGQTRRVVAFNLR